MANLDSVATEPAQLLAQFKNEMASLYEYEAAQRKRFLALPIDRRLGIRTLDIFRPINVPGLKQTLNPRISGGEIELQLRVIWEELGHGLIGMDVLGYVGRSLHRNDYFFRYSSHSEDTSYYDNGTLVVSQGPERWLRHERFNSADAMLNAFIREISASGRVQHIL